MKAFQRSLALASFMLVAASAPSHALSLFPTSTFSPPGGNATFENVVAGAFTDVYTFTLLGSVTFQTSIEAGNSFTTLGGIIDGFAANVFSGSPPTGTLAIAGTPPVLASDGESQSISFDGVLGPGNYFLEVTGTGITGPSAPYAGTVDLAAVEQTPLPGTLPLFATGLSILGIGMMRHKKKGR